MTFNAEEAAEVATSVGDRSWILWATCGEYSDSKYWVLGTCPTEEEASKLRDRCSAWMEEVKEITTGKENDIPIGLLHKCPDPTLVSLVLRYEFPDENELIYFPFSFKEVKWEVSQAPIVMRGSIY